MVSVLPLQGQEVGCMRPPQVSPFGVMEVVNSLTVSKV